MIVLKLIGGLLVTALVVLFMLGASAWAVYKLIKILIEKIGGKPGDKETDSGN